MALSIVTKTVHKKIQHETTAEVMEVARRMYDDFFPQQHPFEMANQPAIVKRFKKGVCGLSTEIIGGTKGRKITLPENSVFTKKYILDSIGI